MRVSYKTLLRQRIFADSGNSIDKICNEGLPLHGSEPTLIMTDNYDNEISIEMVFKSINFNKGHNKKSCHVNLDTEEHYIMEVLR